MSEISTVLIADDDRAIRTVLERALIREGYDVKVSGNARTLWSWVAGGEGDLVITDVIMPDENGLDLVLRIREFRPELKVIVMSAQSTLLTAVKANERGAYEYLPKPFDLPELLAVVERALRERTDTVPVVPAQQIEKLPLIGRSAPMQNIYRVLARLMTTDLTVMVNGESGTGKELVARALHDYGKRRNGPFVAINMAAIPRELVEAELFGYERGAFTGATTRGIGRFEQAQRGTLFLDEIGDMPLDAQTRLLRVLQEGEYTTLGGRTPIKADVRIVAATHRDLLHEVRQGRFREDLYYRLNVVPIRLPPLRERTEDIQELVGHFFARGAENGLAFKTLEPDAMAILMGHTWSGNVRELENLIQRLAALYADDTISSEIVRQELSGAYSAGRGVKDEDETLSEAIYRHLERTFSESDGGVPSKGLYMRILREMEQPLITLTLSATGGNQIRASEILGLNRNTLRKKIRDLDIEVIRGLQ
ncbi:MAG: Nitrogen assimilation regulatory protein [Alphaproteobacteria bacterium MarineAlpha11_Bin1]|nr:MAG: Nitrogen assimilation regulatory protein [Alphaproteobacteria bacterium MarineAlpha11_Bin1]|tara:strand:+ start:2123 stop:3562 length:1440 start_codon:yes stop_codon:yes gene_type:complete